MKFISKDKLGKLIETLKSKGYKVVAPKLKEGVILYDYINSVEELPKGVKEIQEKGYYRVKFEGNSYFNGYVHGFNSLKHFVHPVREAFLKIKRDLSQEVIFEGEKLAFLGVRGCDLKALKILDDVFINKNPHPDGNYRRRRESVFLIGVNCLNPSKNCFCISMKSGPFIESGYDLSLTELKNGFILRFGTEKGREIFDDIEGEEVSEEILNEEKNLIESAKRKIEKNLNTEGLSERLLDNLQNPKWKEIEKRCLACGSCAMVCPTCFCYEVIDNLSWNGEESIRVRKWDVCFREEFSSVHGFPLRKSIFSRYRQWLTHKFSYWVGQFGEFGCVGCGRCITWCPVGIDITQEVKEIAGS